MQATTAVLTPADRRVPIAAAWIVVLLVSDLPEILWSAVVGRLPGWPPVTKAAAPCLLLALCLAWRRLRPLWQFGAVMLVLHLALAASALVGGTAAWRGRFEGAGTSFTLGYVGIYVRDSGIALAVIVLLWLVKRRRAACFLTRGDVRAPVGPVRWMGIGSGESWRTFGWIFTAAASLAVMIPTVLSLPLSTTILLRAAPLLPAVIAFSAINAFNEEIYFRASLLSTLPEVIGRTHAMLLNVVLFGLAHYLYGSPGGVVGFAMTGFLAWLLGKAMLETRGLAWPWMMHFVPDVVVFASYAIAWSAR